MTAGAALARSRANSRICRRRDTGLDGGPLRGVGLDKCPQLVEVVDPLLGKGGIVELVGQQLMDDRQVQGIVGAGPDEQESVGLGGRNAGPDVDDRQFAALQPGHPSGH